MTSHSERSDEKATEAAQDSTEAKTTAEAASNAEDTAPEVTMESDAADDAAAATVEAEAQVEPAAASAKSDTTTEVTMEAEQPQASSDEEPAPDPTATAEQSAAVEGDDRLKSTVKAGQRMEVKLVQVGEKDSFLDYGGTAEGTIATAELKDPDGNLRVNEGETFTAIVRKPGETVEFTIGRSKGGDLLRLRELQSAHEGGIPISGKIKSTNKGGFEVDLGGVRAFCPFSQIDTIYCEKPEEHVGHEYTFEIIAFERGGRNIVLSRRKILELESKEKAGATREKLAVGEVFEGTVRRLQPYGAFVDLGGVDGLVHVSEISRGHVSDPRDVLKVGQQVRVQVIGLDNLGTDRERISLSMKVLERDPWENAAEKWVVGSIVPGKVVRLTDFGAFVELGPGVDGLVHVSEISTERIDHPSSVLAPEQTVEVRILAVDPDARRISLTMRPEGEERPARAPRAESEGGFGGGRRRGGPGRGRDRDFDDRPGESYTFGAEEESKEEKVDVSELDYSDAVELLKQKFNRQ